MITGKRIVRNLSGVQTIEEIVGAALEREPHENAFLDEASPQARKDVSGRVDGP